MDEQELPKVKRAVEESEKCANTIRRQEAQNVGGIESQHWWLKEDLRVRVVDHGREVMEAVLGCQQLAIPGAHEMLVK